MFSMIVVHVTQSIQEWTGYQIVISDSKRYSKFFFSDSKRYAKKAFLLLHGASVLDWKLSLY